MPWSRSSWSGEEGLGMFWMLPKTPPDLQGSVRGITHLREEALSSLRSELVAPKSSRNPHPEPPAIPVRDLPEPPFPCEGSSRAPPAPTLTG